MRQAAHGRITNFACEKQIDVMKKGDDNMTIDPFEEYIRHKEPGKAEKGYAWQTAIGLQAVDGIKTSEYLKQTAIRNIEGEIDFTEAQALLDSYYRENRVHIPDDRTEEADKVSARIAQILSEKAFTFSPGEYIGIHARLFRGIYKQAGKVRDYNISKQEWVLDGKSLLYGNSFELCAALEYDFEQEKKFSYKGLSQDEIIAHLAKFISRLWQIHAFCEGNTRTTAVFFIKYLRYLGYDATNDIFAGNAWYFRNALVRANYNDLKSGIHETTEFLELFLRNLLLNEKNELHNRSMHISGTFNAKQDIGREKQDIDSAKQDIGGEKQDIETALSLHQQKQFEKIVATLGKETVFGRSDVAKILGITASPASALIKKLVDGGKIEAVTGHGKGKYIVK